jgi:hypothetical protein
LKPRYQQLIKEPTRVRKISYIYRCNKKVEEVITFRDCKNLNEERLKSSIESMKQIDVNESDVNRSLNQLNRDITHIINVLYKSL